MTAPVFLPLTAHCLTLWEEEGGEWVSLPANKVIIISDKNGIKEEASVTQSSCACQPAWDTAHS